MTGFCWWLVDHLARLLQAEEREAVQGDFAELGITSGRALVEVFGLVARRQAALWNHWQPWMVLACLVVPLGFLLSVISSFTANRTATYVWLYANNWHWSFLANSGFWYVLAKAGMTVFVLFLTLACCSWISGFVLGSAACRYVQLIGILFCLVLLFGQLMGAPLYWRFLYLFYHRVLGVTFHAGQDPVVYALAFYRDIFPLIVLSLLVLLPMLWGMREGARTGQLRPVYRTLSWIAASLGLAAMLFQAPGLVFFLTSFFRKAAGAPWIWSAWEVRLLQFALFWPVVYVFAVAVSRRWKGHTALT